jgi:uncharacterized caspase-like protein
MLRFLIGALCALMLGTQASAAERLALVIGNAAYGDLGVLENPVSDARLISRSLQQAGFQVSASTDLSNDGMKRAILDFGRALRRAGPDAVGLFYYAGHGVQVRGKNYLLPVGINVQDEADLDIEAVDANWVLGQMESAGNATNIVILDACRNNPFKGSFRSVERGLGRMDAPTGSFIAFATAPGDIALDGRGQANSPYTAALARAMQEPGLPIEQMFKKVRVNVLGATGGRQTPWDSSSLIGDFYFMDGFGAAKAPGPTAAEIELWQQVRDSQDAGQIDVYLRAYPNGAFADEAQTRISSLGTAPTSPAPTTTPTPQTPVPSGDTIALRINTEWSRGKQDCVSPGDLGTIQVSLGASPVTVSSTNSDESLDFSVTAVPSGAGALVTIVPVTPGAPSTPIEVRLDSLAPGASTTEYSNTRIPNRGRCGFVNAYVSVK